MLFPINPENLDGTSLSLHAQCCENPTSLAMSGLVGYDSSDGEEESNGTEKPQLKVLMLLSYNQRA